MLEVYSIDHNGRGISKLDGKIVFIENALPGELIEPLIIKEKKNYILAKVKKYKESTKSKNRQDLVCPYFNECGGCNILHMNYNEQLKFKKKKIEEIITKYAKININIDDIISSDNIFNYRNKVTFHVNNKIGFYNESTHNLIEINECKLLNNLINGSIPYLKKLNLKDITQITCRSNNTELMIIIETQNLKLNIDILKDIASSIYLKKDNKYYLVYGKEKLEYRLGDYKFLISPDSFFQINSNVCEKLYTKIKEFVGIEKNILDLYCGTGTIGMFISKNNNILGIEINESAIKDAKDNRIINNLKNVDFICGDSGKNIENLKFNPNFIIVDPPRSGLSDETINNILKINCNNMIYVSCDPMTLARDITKLNNLYDVIKIIPFDMFPNTKHVESLTILERK